MSETDEFDFFSSRLMFIDVADDPMLNMELWHSLGAFETHVYGIVLQYDRIRSDLRIPKPDEMPPPGQHSAGLDVYYYILTWDKLRKIYRKIQEILNRVRRTNRAFPGAFWPEFRVMHKRWDQLLSEVDRGARDEYEHPCLLPHVAGSIVMWGSMMVGGSGDITVHVGANTFAPVKKEHCKRLLDLRTDLIDLFLRHFSQKPLTRDLAQLRDCVQGDIESIAAELTRLQDKGDTAGFGDLFNKMVMCDLLLGKEGVPLAESARRRLYAVALGTTATSDEPLN